MKVFGVSIVRNVSDIIRVNVLHHLAIGLDGILVVDNGSSDETDRILRELSRRDDRVRWSSNRGPYRQAEISTKLAREAIRAGADWVVPIDANEFWSEMTALGWGAHRYSGLDGAAERTDEVVCLHAVIRGRAAMETKAASSPRMEEVRGTSKVFHWRRWFALSEEGRLDEEWAANSYADGCLDVYGERRPVIFDPRLRDAVAPWIERTPWKRLLARA